jgi:hypothetical protein
MTKSVKNLPFFCLLEKALAEGRWLGALSGRLLRRQLLGCFRDFSSLWWDIDRAIIFGRLIVIR